MADRKNATPLDYKKAVEDFTKLRSLVDGIQSWLDNQELKTIKSIDLDSIAIILQEAADTYGEE